MARSPVGGCAWESTGSFDAVNMFGIDPMTTFTIGVELVAGVDVYRLQLGDGSVPSVSAPPTAVLIIVMVIAVAARAHSGRRHSYASGMVAARNG